MSVTRQMVNAARKVYGTPKKKKAPTPRLTVRIRGKSMIRAFKRITRREREGLKPFKRDLVTCRLLDAPKGTVVVR